MTALTRGSQPRRQACDMSRTAPAPWSGSGLPTLSARPRSMSKRRIEQPPSSTRSRSNSQTRAPLECFGDSHTAPDSQATQRRRDQSSRGDALDHPHPSRDRRASVYRVATRGTRRILTPQTIDELPENPTTDEARTVNTPNTPCSADSPHAPISTSSLRPPFTSDPHQPQPRAPFGKRPDHGGAGPYSATTEPYRPITLSSSFPERPGESHCDPYGTHPQSAIEKENPMFHRLRPTAIHIGPGPISPGGLQCVA